jgi:translation initiation factor IF-2
MEKVLIEAELLDLKANPERNCRGIVIESNMKKGWGSTATIIVQKGTLNVGDAFVSGIHSGKVRALLNEREHKIDSVGPSSPVMVIGFDGLPEVGDTFIATATDAEAREIANERKQLRREQDMRKVRHMTLDQISAQIQIGGVKELNLVIKGDVAGSVEALSDSLQKLSRDEVRVAILHKGVGPITETDVMLAAASNAVVIGFNVNPTGKARKAAEIEMVDIRHYDIIYDCINEIQLALEGLLSPEYKEEVTATVEVRKTFKVSRIGTIAGCIVKSGKIMRNDKVRVLRDGLSEFEGSISSLKRGKDDVRDVDTGFECGIQLAGFNDIMDGDIIEAFKMVEIKRKFK